MCVQGHTPMHMWKACGFLSYYSSTNDLSPNLELRRQSASPSFVFTHRHLCAQCWTCTHWWPCLAFPLSAGDGDKAKLLATEPSSDPSLWVSGFIMMIFIPFLTVICLSYRISQLFLRQDYNLGSSCWVMGELHSACNSYFSSLLF